MDSEILDIWAIQNNPLEIYSALKNIKSDVIIYKNVLCKFKIADKNVRYIKYNDVIYSKDSDVVIFLLRSNRQYLEKAEKYFDEHGVDYNIVTLMNTENETKIEAKNLPEFWYARDAYVIEDAVSDSVSKGHNNCMFYPAVKSLIRFKYPTIKPDASMSSEELFGVNFLGLIKFEDKIILPTYSKNGNNITENEILSILQKYNIDTAVECEENLSLN